MWDEIKSLLVLISAAFILVIGILIAVGAPIFFITQLTKGATVVYTGDVIATTQSNLFFEHTTVIMKTYSEEVVEFSVEGYHDFALHIGYKITIRGSFWRLYRSLIDVQLLEVNV